MSAAAARGMRTQGTAATVGPPALGWVHPPLEISRLRPSHRCVALRLRPHRGAWGRRMSRDL